MSKTGLVIAAALAAGPGVALAGASFGSVDVAQQLFCDMPEIRGEFDTRSSRYSARGLCKMVEAQQSRKAGESTFDNYNNARELYRFNWTATGSYDPVTKTTIEELVAPPPRVDEPSPPGRPYGRFRLETICDKDPWLDETAARCAPPRTSVTGNLSPDAQKTLAFTGRPFTAHMTSAQRATLRKLHDERMAMLESLRGGSLRDASTTLQSATTTSRTEGSYTPGAATTSVATATTNTATLGKRKLPSTSTEPTGGAGGSATTTATAGATPAPSPAQTSTPTAPPPVPQIVAPPAGVPQHAGQLRVQVKPVPGTEAATAELEFVWLAPRNGEAGDRPPAAPIPLRWQAPMAQLMQGVVVPAHVGPSTSGRWQLRLHPTTAGAAWSAPAVFDFVANPAAAQAAAANTLPSQAKAWGRDRELERRGLNPQPLPPRDGPSTELQKRGLNPQPLPPKESAAPRSAFERPQAQP